MKKRVLSEEHMAALQAGRIASLQSGYSAKEVAQAKRIEALSWLYRWGWSAPTVLDTVVGVHRGSMGSKLEKLGLVRRHKGESGGVLRDVPACCLTLTKAGEAELTRTFSSEAQFRIYRGNIPWHQLRHDFIVQRLVAEAYSDHTLGGYRTERELRGSAAKTGFADKVPDAALMYRDGSITYIEVELTAKQRRELDTFVAKTLATLTGNPKARVRVLSDSQGLLELYRKRFQPGASLKVWARDSIGWRVDDTRRVPNVSDRLTFELLR